MMAALVSGRNRSIVLRSRLTRPVYGEVVMTDRVRFWHFHRDGWVKLTVRGEQVLSFGYGGPTEEGWSSHSDGRLTQTTIVRCPIDKLASEKCALDDAPGLVPEWTTISARQRDEYAEAMGY